MKIRLKRGRQRNPLHDHPLLKKGGVHQKTRKAMRKRDKQAIKREWADPVSSAVIV